MSSPSSILLHLVATLRKVHFDYTPQWKRDASQKNIIAVTFPRVLVDKRYSYRVVCEDNDLGIRRGTGPFAGGAETVNFLEYSHGSGIPQTHRLRVYVVDPDTGNQYLVAQRN
ncbi:Immunomodulatory protein Ling Zhi-8 [Trametes pubescens]|uniref:Immunomodulatory protein Ling Zhi-8 n=1 Tax=Trametes pubescens TaxID=154538 RepID=A0A1M2V762_TRAPU|nr:Immunomodulatory protein Ling Zhi-8 [Trametes pubescens]